jgi:hypothetical protein
MKTELWSTELTSLADGRKIVDLISISSHPQSVQLGRDMTLYTVLASLKSDMFVNMWGSFSRISVYSAHNVQIWHVVWYCIGFIFWYFFQHTMLTSLKNWHVLRSDTIMCWVHFIMFSAYSARACYNSDMLFANWFISCISAGGQAAKLSPDNLRSCWLHFRHTHGLLFFRVFLSWVFRTLEMDPPSPHSWMNPAFGTCSCTTCHVGGSEG